jgi:cytochrome bd-type quinol oxidase subunit 2
MASMETLELVLIVIAVPIAAATPLGAWLRMRDADRARDFWLSMNAHPRWAVAGCVFIAVECVVGGVAGTALALTAYPYMWSLTAVAVGCLVALGILMRVAVQPPQPTD